ncbi:hypothetical protein LAZ40_16300 [Cereibacter sphaeroides]|uniref:hypothetical protein n=1 Tax=Cereibacter sphaeroides TaxID=1063 RepID=UPI001F2782A8|nr:hypothetical protein [Cereibacter sphaeroides]MCE6960587.1 hypothetical protein [Cereibacter sphaeroides]MCE6972732.1 hypothetical protein [Cereibacter sphaeroides]
MQADEFTRICNRWHRVVKRADRVRDRVFIEKMDRKMKDPAWRPTEAQFDLMQDMAAIYEADRPIDGETRINPTTGHKERWIEGIRWWGRVYE